MIFNNQIPFNDLPTLPPKVDIETKTILKKTINANKALAGLKGVCRTIPNPLILVNAIILQEAKDKTVPLLERMRFLAIYSSNLDEFFRVRVAEVRRLISLSTSSSKQQSKELLAAIQAATASGFNGARLIQIKETS